MTEAAEAGLFCYVWRYRVRPERREEFRDAYGPDGDWVRLFRRDPGHVRTTLLADHDDPNRFVTIDLWTSREAFAAFRRLWAEEFEAIDRRCAELTAEESLLGDFAVVG
ncbi:MAG: hypothetical protein GC160_23560 [Acidobacteria bacterium]|nr:hypothetical protein [Acidobacteriota bacterium]